MEKGHKASSFLEFAFRERSTQIRPSTSMRVHRKFRPEQGRRLIRSEPEKFSGVNLERVQITTSVVSLFQMELSTLFGETRFREPFGTKFALRYFPSSHN
jgi:hypothetical protein